MTPEAEERWEILELIGSYAAGELEGEAVSEAERLVSDSPDYRRIAESYARMLVMLSVIGAEPAGVPEAVVGQAVRRANVSALLRQADRLARGLAADYLGALVFYLGLRPARRW